MENMNMNIEKIKADIAKLDEIALDNDTANNVISRDFFERLVGVLSHLHGRIIDLEEEIDDNITTDLNESQYYKDKLYGISGEHD